MSGFDATLIGAIISFIILFLSELDHPNRLKLIAVIFAVCIIALLSVAWCVGWETVVPLPQRPSSVTTSNTPNADETQNIEYSNNRDGTNAPNISSDITVEQALSALKRWIDNLIMQILVYGILIGVVVKMIKSLFR